MTSTAHVRRDVPCVYQRGPSGVRVWLERRVHSSRKVLQVSASGSRSPSSMASTTADRASRSRESMHGESVDKKNLPTTTIFFTSSLSYSLYTVMEGIHCVVKGCDQEDSLTCPSCGSAVCVYCINECDSCQYRCCEMCHRPCEGCDEEIICGKCSHTCQSCSLTGICKDCNSYPLTDDGKTQCIECAPSESDSSDDTFPTQTGYLQTSKDSLPQAPKGQCMKN